MKKALYILWIVPALLLWASFPPRGEMVNILFALAPLLWVSRRGGVGGLKSAPAIIWGVNGLVFYLATLSWMPAIVKNGGPWPLVALGLIALSAYCALYFAAFGSLIQRMHAWAREGKYWRRLLVIVVFEPILWAGLELVRSRFGGGFAWNQLGVVAVNAGFGAPASLGGVYLLSMVIVLINGTIAGVAERVFRKGGTSLETLVPLALVFLIYWPCRGGEVEKNVLRVALIQRNFPCVFNPRRAQDPVTTYSNLVQNVALLKPDLVVLPESAMAEFGRLDGHNAKWFAAKLREWTGASMVIAGGTRFGSLAGDDFSHPEYNSAALYTEEGCEIYDKVHLVPFGEFIPGDKLIPALQKLAPVGSCTPGEVKLLGDFGVAICYEDTDSAQIRKLAKLGAKALVFITNDSWFSHSDEAVQHAWQSVARAIETGLPIIRVGNSGVTGTVLPDGTTSWLTDANGCPLTDAQGTMFDRISLGGGTLTPYTLLGDIPLFLLFIACLLSQIMIEYKVRRENSQFKELTNGED